ncbi:BglII/BstYI family type II restriction endonuclease [Trichlorobacter ammonificans]|nr:BglII/BstYI family type II restriction endonuclease [Trichlorobacter ammonificans]
MKITAMKFYGGAREKVCRLGLADLFLELQQIIFETTIEIEETRDANGAAFIREELDSRFSNGDDWVKTASGGVDWVKRIRYNSTFMARIGVEIQVSARSDLLIRDIVHLRNSLQEGHIDVGAIVVPSDRFQLFLPDRTPSYRDAIRYIEQEFKEAMTFPIVVIAIEHDGTGNALPKKRTNKGKAD